MRAQATTSEPSAVNRCQTSPQPLDKNFTRVHGAFDMANACCAIERLAALQISMRHERLRTVGRPLNRTTRCPHSAFICAALFGKHGSSYYSKHSRNATPSHTRKALHPLRKERAQGFFIRFNDRLRQLGPGRLAINRACHDQETPVRFAGQMACIGPTDAALVIS